MKNSTACYKAAALILAEIKKQQAGEFSRACYACNLVKEVLNGYDTNAKQDQIDEIIQKIRDFGQFAERTDYGEFDHTLTWGTARRVRAAATQYGKDETYTAPYPPEHFMQVARYKLLTYIASYYKSIGQ